VAHMGRFLVSFRGDKRVHVSVPIFVSGGTQLRSSLKHYATSQKVAGSSPDEVDFF
jgi:hypothetical protein